MAISPYNGLIIFMWLGILRRVEQATYILGEIRDEKLRGQSALRRPFTDIYIMYTREKRPFKGSTEGLFLRL